MKKIGNFGTFCHLKELRLRYHGAVPLSDQEKFANNVRKSMQERQEMHEKLLKASEKEQEASAKLEEFQQRQAGLEELIATLTEGNGAKKVQEWHQKMENLRLAERRLSREIERHREQSVAQQNLIKTLENTIDRIDSDLVGQTKNFEERELEWEAREAELELKLQQFETQTQWEIKQMHEVIKCR